MSNDRYAARSQQNAPRTVDELREAARAMLRDGFGENTIAAALRLEVDAVRRLLGSCVECER